MNPQPKFRLQNRHLVLAESPEASKVAEEVRRMGRAASSKPPAVVEKEARAHLTRLGCKSPSELQVLANTAIQFGKFQGQTFKWLLENAAGWSVHLLLTMQREGEGSNTSQLGANKGKFKAYAMNFPEVSQAVRFKGLVEEAMKTVKKTGDEGHRLLEFGEYEEMTWYDMVTSKEPAHQRYLENFILKKKDVIPGTKMSQFRAYCLRSVSQTPVSATTAAVDSGCSEKGWKL